MSAQLKHVFESDVADGADSSKLRPSDWGRTGQDHSTNPTHEFTGGAEGTLLVRDDEAVDGASWVAPHQLNVKAPPYLAAGDGVTDDTAAIQAAIDDLQAAGGGVIYFPSGEYKVNVTATSGIRALRIYPNIRIRGAGMTLTTIKLAADQGDYRAIMAPHPTSADCSGFYLSDLTINQNATENTTSPSVEANDANSRMAVCIFAGSNLAVERLRVEDIDAINTVVLYNTDIRIADCVFSVVGNTTDHDYSCIYTTGTSGGTGVVIHGNTFRGAVAGRGSIATAIETHGGWVHISHNNIENFRIGMNLTGTAVPSRNIIAVHNTIDAAEIGVQLWSAAGFPLTNCLVQGNAISLSHAIWEAPTVSGVALAQSSDAGVLNVTIADNLIQLVGAIGAVSASDTFGCGVIWYRLNGAIVDQNLAIRGNTVDRALACGVRVSTSVQALQVVDNILRNVGLSTGAFNDAFRSGVILSGSTMTDVMIARNIILDDQVTSTIKQGVLNAATTITNGHVLDNILRVADASSVPEYSRNAAQVVELRTTRPLEMFADNAAALAGGLKLSQMYRTGDAVKVVHA